MHYQEGKFALANLLVALLPNDHSHCEAKYLYYLLLTKKDELFVPMMQGTANVSLKEQNIANVEVSLPELPKQRRIVAQIEELAAQIDSVRGLRKEQDHDTGALLDSAFWKLSANASTHPLREVAPVVRRPADVQPQEVYPELEIRSFGRGTFHKPELTGIEVGSKRLFKIMPGDLLFMNVFAWEGAIAVASPDDKNRYGSHRFISCVPYKNLATPNFLRYYFLTSEGLEKVRQASPGGAGRNRTLGLGALGEIKIPIPTINQQRWFDALQADVDKLKRVQAESAAALDALLPSILDHAFRGEL